MHLLPQLPVSTLQHARAQRQQAQIPARNVPASCDLISHGLKKSNSTAVSPKIATSAQTIGRTFCAILPIKIALKLPNFSNALRSDDASTYGEGNGLQSQGCKLNAHFLFREYTHRVHSFPSSSHIVVETSGSSSTVAAQNGVGIHVSSLCTCL